MYVCILCTADVCIRLCTLRADSDANVSRNVRVSCVYEHAAQNGPESDVTYLLERAVFRGECLTFVCPELDARTHARSHIHRRTTRVVVCLRTKLHACASKCFEPPTSQIVGPRRLVWQQQNADGLPLSVGVASSSSPSSSWLSDDDRTSSGCWGCRSC